MCFHCHKKQSCVYIQTKSKIKIQRNFLFLPNIYLWICTKNDESWIYVYTQTYLPFEHFYLFIFLYFWRYVRSKLFFWQTKKVYGCTTLGKLHLNIIQHSQDDFNVNYKHLDKRIETLKKTRPFYKITYLHIRSSMWLKKSFCYQT